MKKLSLALIIVILFAALGLALGFIWWTSVAKAPTKTETKIRLVIPKGASVESIGNTLKKEGAIKSSLAFKIYVQTKDIGKKIPPGEFTLSSNLNLSETVQKLLKGPDEIWVTIPEGFRREQVVEAFIDGLELTDVKAQNFRTEFLENSANLEGFLFPDTYLVPKDITASNVVDLLKSTFDQKFSYQGDLTLNQAVTLASIIERETKSAEERPMVAGIYFNRLDIGMALQADATVQYAVGTPGNWWPKNLTRVQITGTDSPYNTYLYPGIPPAPIANPGLTSLKAVQNPQDSSFLYYIHDEDSIIHYARNLDEHNTNIARYLK